MLLFICQGRRHSVQPNYFNQSRHSPDITRCTGEPPAIREQQPTEVRARPPAGDPAGLVARNGMEGRKTRGKALPPRRTRNRWKRSNAPWRREQSGTHDETGRHHGATRDATVPRRKRPSTPSTGRTSGRPQRSQASPADSRMYLMCATPAVKQYGAPARKQFLGFQQTRGE